VGLEDFLEVRTQIKDLFGRRGRPQLSFDLLAELGPGHRSRRQSSLLAQHETPKGINRRH
jgi:hypothetical protein